MSTNVSKTTTASLAAVALLSPAVSGWGAEDASTEYIGGFAGFAAGFVPPESGSYFSNFLYFYSGSASAAPVNGQVAVNLSTDVYFEIAQVIRVTQYTLLTARN
jgi:hypothetical protein